MGFSVTYPPSTTVYWYVSDAEVVELGKDADLLVYDGDDWDAIYKLKNKTLDKFRAVQEKNVYDTLGQGVSTWLEQGYEVLRLFFVFLFMFQIPSRTNPVV